MSKKYNALVILGGGIKNDNGKWRTINLDEEDGLGVAGGQIRVIAGGLLFSQGFSSLIVSSGGKGRYKDVADAPTVSEVMKRELIDLGIPSKIIIEESQSKNTYQQLKAVLAIKKAKKWGSIGIISNDYHLPRIKAMFDYGPGLVGLRKAVHILSGEGILLSYSPGKWKKICEDAYQSESMKKRVALEKKGVKDIRNGKYDFK